MARTSTLVAAGLLALAALAFVPTPAAAYPTELGCTDWDTGDHICAYSNYNGYCAGSVARGGAGTPPYSCVLFVDARGQVQVCVLSDADGEDASGVCVEN